ncbi:MAG: FAD:protein FMN transferase [Planctomycetota bacterium]
MNEANNQFSRRDFLTGKSLVGDSQNGESNRTGIPHQVAQNRSQSYVEQYSRNAMACEFEISLNLHQYRHAGQAVMDAFELLSQLESQMTVYSNDSEVSEINREAFDVPYTVERKLFRLFQRAKKLHQQTGGAFDITSGQLFKLWGFFKRDGKVPQADDIDRIISKIGSEHIILDPVEDTIRITQSGCEINLGAIGKGFALDRMGQIFQERKIDDFVIHGGQSSVLANGSSVPNQNESAKSSENPGWKIGVTHPTLPGKRLGEVSLNNQALGTSGTARQGFYFNGKRYGHIIDPRTGWPTNHFLSTTVVTSIAADADALATAFFVMQLDEIFEYCSQNPDVGAILVAPDSSAKGKIKIHTANLNGGWLPED